MNFIGVDQTGAVGRDGRCKPLQAALLQKAGGRFELSPFQLRELSFKEFTRHPSSPQDPRNYTWVIDCVLGLPSGFPELRQVLELAAQTTQNGRQAAQDFFESLLAGSTWKVIPARKVELLVGANSVFRNKPFQRNIQTGTFRIWKELGADPDWFTLAGHEPRSGNRSWLIEGYPSFAWQQLFSVKKRSPQDFRVLLKNRFPDLHISKSNLTHFMNSTDACDAAVLALQAATQEESVAYYSQSLAPEGWILGAV